MNNSFIIEQLKYEFTGKPTFTREELYSFYHKFSPDLKETTFRWRVHDLKEKHLIASLSKGVFTLTYKPTYEPPISEFENRLGNKIQKQFPTLKYCLWSTKAINEFMLHIPDKFITILEVENDAIEPMFSFLKEQNLKNVFLQPETKEIERYLFETDSSIVLESLVSKAPKQLVNNISTITIEKLIVDLFVDRKLFNAYQGSELIHIINTIYRRYSVNFTTVFSYARRRRKKGLMEFLLNNTDIPQSIFHD